MEYHIKVKKIFKKNFKMFRNIKKYFLLKKYAQDKKSPSVCGGSAGSTPVLGVCASVSQ